MQKRYFLAMILCAAALGQWAGAQALTNAEAQEQAENLVNPEGPEAQAASPEQRAESPDAQKAALDYFITEAPTRHNDPRRLWEAGSLTGINLANNVGSIRDLFYKNLVIDLDKMNRDTPKDGLRLNLDLGFHGFINVNPNKNAKTEGPGETVWERDWGVGGFLGGNGRVDVHLPKDLITLVSQGNYDQHNVTGTLAVSGAAYAEAGLKGHMTLLVLDRKLRLEAAPAWFLPIAYIPRSTLDITLVTEDRLQVSTNADASVYMPFDAKGQMKDFGGGDLSVSGEYALFPILDLGAAIFHILVIPARLSNKAGFGFENDLYVEDVFQWMQKDNPMDDMGDFKLSDLASTKEIWVVRPLRFDVYALFRPLRNDFLTVKPNIGFTVINPSEENYFNWGLEGQLNFADILYLSLGTGLEEGLWRHKLGLTMDFHAIALHLGAGLRSQDFAHSFQLNGLSVNLGCTIGW